MINFNYRFFTTQFNPYHAEFLKWNNPSSIYRTFHYHFKGYQDENLKLVSQQYTDSMHGCAGWPGSILMAKANYFRLAV